MPAAQDGPWYSHTWRDVTSALLSPSTDLALSGPSCQLLCAQLSWCQSVSVRWSLKGRSSSKKITRELMSCEGVGGRLSLMLQTVNTPRSHRTAFLVIIKTPFCSCLITWTHIFIISGVWRKNAEQQIEFLMPLAHSNARGLAWQRWVIPRQNSSIVQEWSPAVRN